jgi:hypothetical protein
MTKRSLESDINELSDEILGDLDPTDRVALMLRAGATGHDDWMDRLRQTCPKHTYRTHDTEYTNRMQLATAWAAQARYGLRFAFERHRFAMLRRQRDTWLSIVAAEEMESLVAEVTAETEERPAPIDWVAELAVCYCGRERFAEDVLGISLAEWIGGIPGDDGITESAAELLELYEPSLDIGSDGGGDSEDVVAVADDVTELYEGLKESWEHVDDPLSVRDYRSSGERGSSTSS